MQKNIIIHIQLKKNNVIVKKSTNQNDIEHTISCDLINNFLENININRNKWEKYNDSIILGYIQWRLEKALWKELSPKKEKFIHTITEKLYKFSDELKEILDDHIENNIKKNKISYRPFDNTTKIKINSSTIIDEKIEKYEYKNQNNKNQNIVPAQIYAHNVGEIDDIFDYFLEIKNNFYLTDPKIVTSFHEELELFSLDIGSHSFQTNMERLETIERQYITFESEKSIRKKKKNRI